MLLPLFTLAYAVVYGGNPHVGFRVDRPADDFASGDVWLDEIRVHHTGGGTTVVDVDAWIDPVEAQWVAIPPGDHASLTFVWGSTMLLDGDAGAFELSYDEPKTTVVLDVSIQPVPLTPYTVEAGTYTGGPPALWVTVQ